MTTVAQSAPPIMEALKRRALLQQQQNAIAAMSQGFAPGNEKVFENPQAIANYVNSGAGSMDSVMQWQGKADETKRKSKADEANIRYKNALADHLEKAKAEGLTVVGWQQDSDGNLIPKNYSIPGASKENTVVSPKPNEQDPIDKYVDRKLNKQLGAANPSMQQAALKSPADAGESIPANAIKFSYEIGGVTYNDWVISKDFPKAKADAEKAGAKNIRIRK